MHPDPKRVEAVFAAALEKATAERQAYLDEVCAGDGALRQRVEALLKAHERKAASSISLSSTRRRRSNRAGAVRFGTLALHPLCLRPSEQTRRQRGMPRQGQPSAISAITSCWRKSLVAAWVWCSRPGK